MIFSINFLRGYHLLKHKMLGFFPCNSMVWEHQSYRENMMHYWLASILIFELRHVLLFVCWCFTSVSYHRDFSTGSCKQACGKLCYFYHPVFSVFLLLAWVVSFGNWGKVSREKNILLHKGLWAIPRTAPPEDYRLFSVMCCMPAFPAEWFSGFFTFMPSIICHSYIFWLVSICFHNCVERKFLSVITQQQLYVSEMWQEKRVTILYLMLLFSFCFCFFISSTKHSLGGNNIIKFG